MLSTALPCRYRNDLRQRTFKGEFLGTYTTPLGLEAMRTQGHQMAGYLEPVHMVVKHWLARLPVLTWNEVPAGGTVLVSSTEGRHTGPWDGLSVLNCPGV